ncbi:hypothetical protein TYRP_016310 [Tyrophagus putrescentiae]|nr:hypothetical protein TYRP_016310 [Tyrophagus putrescentiae]
MTVGGEEKEEEEELPSSMIAEVGESIGAIESCLVACWEEEEVSSERSEGKIAFSLVCSCRPEIQY